MFVVDRMDVWSLTYETTDEIMMESVDCDVSDCEKSGCPPSSWPSPGVLQASRPYNHTYCTLTSHPSSVSTLFSHRTPRYLVTIMPSPLPRCLGETPSIQRQTQSATPGDLASYPFSVTLPVTVRKSNLPSPSPLTPLNEFHLPLPPSSSRSGQWTLILPVTVVPCTLPSHSLG